MMTTPKTSTNTSPTTLSQRALASMPPSERPKAKPSRNRTGAMNAVLSLWRTLRRPSGYFALNNSLFSSAFATTVNYLLVLIAFKMDLHPETVA